VNDGPIVEHRDIAPSPVQVKEVKYGKAWLERYSPLVVVADYQKM
jgi:hypothetical protein